MHKNCYNRPSFENNQILKKKNPRKQITCKISIHIILILIIFKICQSSKKLKSYQILTYTYANSIVVALLRKEFIDIV